MSKDLYFVLGVGKDADATAIKKAYRQKAQKLHPDKAEGDKEAFQELIAAYEVLIDEHKRKHYDESGEILNDAGEEHKHLRELVAVLFALVDAVEDVRRYNLVSESKRVVNGGIAKANQAIANLEETIEIRREVLKRLTCKNPVNLLAQALESDIAQRQAGIRNMQDNAKVGQEVLKMLDDYDYRVDTQAVPTGFLRSGHRGTGFYRTF